ncbi:MAG TPA: transposase [Verrucomicrobiae bacterium]|nr:transposase [Verrucomicrobiae bacterium]
MQLQIKKITLQKCIMTSGVTINKDEIIDALYKNEGKISHAARSLGIADNTIYEWRKKDESVAFAIDDAREKHREKLKDLDGPLVEEAYKSLNYLLKGNDVTATIFTLKAKAKWLEHKLKEDDSNKSITVNIHQKPWFNDKDCDHSE